MTPNLKRLLGQAGKFKPGDKVVVTQLPFTMSHFHKPKKYAVVIDNYKQRYGYKGDDNSGMKYTLWFPETDSTSAWYPEECLDLMAEH